jgi:hypothetical protein
MKLNLVSWSAILIAASTGAVAAQDATKKIELKVLYAGVLEAPRTADFKEFLEGAFTKVGTIELTTLDAKTAAGFDVVIVDSPSPYQGEDGFEMPKTPDLDLGFTKPTILMGAAGGRMLKPLAIKLQWL